MKTSTETIIRPPDLMIHKYCVDATGTIYYVEQFASTGWYICARLRHTGTPIDSKLTSLKELSKMRMFSNLRESRAVAGMTATRNAKMKATFGDILR
jgi:hypothetical protein